MKEIHLGKKMIEANRQGITNIRNNKMWKHISATDEEGIA